MMKTAEELGFEIEFNTDTPGILDLSTGKHYNYSEILSDYFIEEKSKKYSIEETFPKEKIKSYKPVRVSIGSDKFSFPAAKLTDTNIAS